MYLDVAVVWLLPRGDAVEHAKLKPWEAIRNGRLWDVFQFPCYVVGKPPERATRVWNRTVAPF